MISKLREAHERFQENLDILTKNNRRDEDAMLIWNLSAGLGYLVEVLDTHLHSTESTLREIKTNLQRLG